MGQSITGVEGFLEQDAGVDEDDGHRYGDGMEHVADDVAGFLHGGECRDAVTEDVPRPEQEFLRSAVVKGSVQFGQIGLAQSRHRGNSPQVTACAVCIRFVGWGVGRGGGFPQSGHVCRTRI